jgi:hypothetical protein
MTQSPAGWKLVPVEPTEAMIREVEEAARIGGIWNAASAYIAMVEAAPLPASPAADRAVSELSDKRLDALWYHRDCLDAINRGDLMAQLRVFARAVIAADRALVRSTDAPSEPVSPSEALYAFAAWLTCRDEATTFGSRYNAAPAADAVQQFINSQGFAEPRQDWTTRLKPYPLATPPAASTNDVWAKEDAQKVLRIGEELYAKFNPPAASTSAQGEAKAFVKRAMQLADALAATATEDLGVESRGWRILRNKIRAELKAHIETGLAATTPAPACRAEPATDARAEASDTQMLDWLETQRTASGFEDIPEGNEWGTSGPYRTLRECIRAALAAATDGGKQA